MVSMTATLSPRHLLLALAVVAVWGTNFVVIKVALEHLPPLLLATLRFTLAALPLVFVLPRPPVPLLQLAAYGVLIGAGDAPSPRPGARRPSRRRRRARSAGSRSSPGPRRR